MVDRPTKAQSELLDFIDGFIREHGYGPSYREIMRALNYKSVSTVAVHVDNLIKVGRLQKTDRSARSLVVVDESSPVARQSDDDNAGVQWLEHKVKAKLSDYRRAPDDNKRRQLEVLASALDTLGLANEAESLRANLRGENLV